MNLSMKSTVVHQLTILNTAPAANEAFAHLESLDYKQAPTKMFFLMKIALDLHVCYHRLSSKRKVCKIQYVKTTFFIMPT